MTEPTLQSARDAMALHDWDAARDRFLALDQVSPLEPDDLEMLGEAEWWSGRPDDRVDIMERAFTGYVNANRPGDAARIALGLSETSMRRLAVPVAMGWMKRAEALLESVPDSPVHALGDMFRAFYATISHDFPAAVDAADMALETARRVGDRDVEALATNIKGQALIKSGSVEQGLALVDESTIAAVGGELTPWATANVYCGTMSACRDLSDWERAGTWTDEAERQMGRQRITGYPGVCRVHRAEIKRLRGEWPAAAEEAQLACDELQKYRLLFDLGWAFYELGEGRRLMGDAAGAERAFQQANELGRDPVPGLALLRLAQGDAAGASSAMRRALSVADPSSMSTGDSGDEPLGRSHLLPAMVTIALATGDLDAADTAAAELEEIAEQFGSTAIRAEAAGARGAVLLARGETRAAVEALARGRHLWQVVRAPYEVAKVRMNLASAYESEGAETDAQMEREAARSTFERLGAVPDLRAVEADLARQGATRATVAGPRVTKTFMFTDIVTSTDLLEALGDQAWEDLMGWHDTTLRSLIGGHAGEEVSHTGDGFFVAFAEPRAALDAAVAIQRAFANHRRDHGFAPWLRIGVHTAEVSRAGENYRGVGVHIAARVSAQADREEILVSATTLAAAGALPYPTSERESVSLKGIKQPIEVARIAWR
jgi:class 3 adenylate cyclase